MNTSEHFLEWLKRSGCRISRPGWYDVSFAELEAAYKRYCETGENHFEYLDLIADPRPQHWHMCGYEYFTKEQIALYDRIAAGETIWRASLADKLKDRMEESRAFWEREETYERRRIAANLHISDKAVRNRILDRDGHKCRKCGSTESLAIDHIVAVRNGGGDEDANLQVLCKSCNSSKGAR